MSFKLATLAIVIVALWPLQGCGTSPLQPDAKAQANMFAQDKALFASNVGKKFWVQTELRLCPQPNNLAAGCSVILAPARLTVDRIEEGIQQAGGRTLPIGSAYCHATLDDGRSGYATCAELALEATDVEPGAAEAECKRRGVPRIGMSAKQVEATCWGKPDHVNRSQTAGGISDQYVYGDSRYVYLDNGIVTSIQTSGTLR